MPTSMAYLKAFDPTGQSRIFESDVEIYGVEAHLKVTLDVR
jgi:hypothetical protein